VHDVEIGDHPAEPEPEAVAPSIEVGARDVRCQGAEMWDYASSSRCRASAASTASMSDSTL